MKDFKNCNFSNNCGFDFILFTTTISLFLARDLTPGEQNLLGNFFAVLGQNLSAIAGYCDYIEDLNADDIIN